MRILQAAPSSVLWLSGGSPEVVTNLRRASLEHDIAPERLVFAPRIAASAQHLARYRLADLFLDTLPFNAHATASDALWAGLPVLTCRGGSFAGRVAASLLTAMGLPELITTSLEEYQAQALRLATTPALLSELRLRLLAHRSTHALFDTARYTTHLEIAFSTMLDRHRRGESPLGFTVSSPPD
jgi:predicted O-linked N-acetylglucosamine transferase (SPINDLY family)